MFSFFILGFILTHVLHITARKILICDYQLTLPSLPYPFWSNLVGGTLFTIPILLQSELNIQSILLIALLITVTITDLYAQLIPNKFLILFAFPLLFINPNLIAPLMIFLLFYLSTSIATFLFKKDTLGGGDVKLYLVIALVLDVKPLLLSVLLASLLALIYILFLKKEKDAPIPFAPFIAIATYSIYLGILLDTIPL